MHVEDRLAGAAAGVEDEPELAVGELVGDVAGDRDELGEQRRVALGELDDVAVLARLRGHDDVHGRLRGDVVERDHAVGLGHDLRGDLTRDDALEEGRLGSGLGHASHRSEG